MFVTEFAQDLIYYFRYSGVSPFQSAAKKRFYKIIIETHALEKGLSLAAPRNFFGREKIHFLMAAAKKSDLTLSDFPLHMMAGAFQGYIRLHREKGLSDPILTEMEAFLSSLSFVPQESLSYGVRVLNWGEMANGRGDRAISFLASRFACRMFDRTPIDLKLVTEIVRIAQSSPSQCNRQATKAYFFQEQSKIRALLALQGGASGFSESVGNLFVVTFDLAAWGGPQQRNQGYVDAGLFSMNLLLACQAFGVASCPLNLAVSHSIERQIRREAGIPEDQRLVMMVGVGRPLSGLLKIASSPRRNVDEILRFGDDLATNSRVI